VTEPVGEHSAPVVVSREVPAPRRRSDDATAVVDSSGIGIVLGDLLAAARPRIAEILRGTRVFSRAEIDVALEVFDERGPEYLFLGAFTPEAVLVGYACWGPTPATDRTWDLYWIAVDTTLQGAGIGTILLDEVERRLAGQRARMLIAETSSRPDYGATRRFYARQGYAEAARVRDYYAPGDDRILFVKRFLPLAD
jgi:ribosomal protein S18 acetylase RimI-like enzyme